MSVEDLIRDLYIDAPGAALRDEDRRKSIEVEALLRRALARLGRPAAGRRRTIVDLGCGQGYAGIALARLWGAGARLVGVERDPPRAERCRAIAARLGLDARFQVADIAAAELPDRPDLVIALHACGAATDAAIARTIEVRATFGLLVPCCHPRAAGPPDEGFRWPGVLRRRWDVLTTDARRLLCLEAAGYAVTAAELVAPTVSPDNLVLDARWIGPSRRAERARVALASP